MVKISPSVLSADFSNLEKQISNIEELSDFIHIDVMDGHFVPNITVGPLIVSAVRKITKLPLDVHLMISEPDKYIEAFAEAGSDWITVHQEACIHLNRTLLYIKQLGKKAGVAINPATPIATLEEVLDIADLILVMTVNPGFGGQKFIERSIKKIVALRKMMESIGSKAELSVDGGVKAENIGNIVSAGASMLVAGSEIFHSKDPKKTIITLKEKGNRNA